MWVYNTGNIEEFLTFRLGFLNFFFDLEIAPVGPLV